MRSNRGFAWLLAVLVGLTGGPARVLAAEHDSYHVGSGDQLRVTVFGEDDLSGDYKVDGQGTLALPLVGKVPVGGKSLPDVEQAITQAYGGGYLKTPRVSVNVTNFRPFYILGEIKAPGSYPYVEGMKIVNAVALAGGYTYRAKEDDLLITRAGDAAHGKQHASKDTVVLPGDVIEVQERFF